MPLTKPPAPLKPRLDLTATRFSDLAGWKFADPGKALAAFLRSCSIIGSKPSEAALGGVGYAGTPADWRDACETARGLPAPSAAAARAFFEASFVPYRLSDNSPDGLFTGYYEPELKGSRTQHGPYQTPLFGLPADLVTVDLGLFRDMYRGQRLTGRVANGRLVPYPARAQIVREGVPAKPLLYVDNTVEAFFLQIQGSGRVVLDDGTIVRANFAAQNGQPYTAIGAVLIERGELKREEVSAQSIKAWLAAHPDQAAALMDRNASYVFFSEQPIGDPSLGAPGAQGVSLTPEVSLAVDMSIHALGVPAWLEGSMPGPDAQKPDRDLNALLVMQDTGGAIRGGVRGDIYWGYGARAADIAGRMKHRGRLTVLLPKSLAARIGARAGYMSPP